jgi:hypothetical protein
MSCLFSFKIIFAIIGWRLGGGRGLFFGFLLGWLIDSMYRRPTIRFTFRRGTADDFTGYQQQQQSWQKQTWQPYTDVTLQEAYRTLGIPETATEDEVRQAYRKMALRYHPDHVAAEGEAAREAAEKKFREITEARDIIFRSRGI